MLKVRNLAKWFETPDGVAHAVRGIDFGIKEGEFYTLLGPSGCGKTTTLRCVAGLERPNEGEIMIGDTLVEAPKKDVHAPAHDRDIGMVFQSYAIWPHLDVFENVAYPLRVNKPRLPSSEITERVMDSLRLVGMVEFASRSATKLSGGQQQRVALARALVRKPKLLLLDEPLSNLDAKLREHMRIELEELVSRLRLTTLYVTHDQSEALSMSDRIAVMADGRIAQEGPPQRVYARPANEFVAGFLGGANFMPGIVEKLSEGTMRVALANGIGVIELTADGSHAVGDALRLMVRPEHIRLIDSPPPSEAGLLAGRVRRIDYQGSYCECLVEVPPMRIRCKIEGTAEVKHGDDVWLAIESARCVAFRA